METMQLTTTSQLKLINAFQMKHLREIVGYPPTFIDRMLTNEEVFKWVNRYTGPKGKTKISISNT